MATIMDIVNKCRGDIVKKSVLLNMKFHKMTKGGYFQHLVKKIMQDEIDDLTFPYNLAHPAFKKMSLDPKFIDFMNALKEMKKQRVCKYGDYEITFAPNTWFNYTHGIIYKGHMYDFRYRNDKYKIADGIFRTNRSWVLYYVLGCSGTMHDLPNYLMNLIDRYMVEILETSLKIT